MKLNKLFLFISLLLISPSIINADCTKEDFSNFKKIEKEYKVDTKYNKETNSYDLIVTMSEPENYIIAPYIEQEEEIAVEEIDSKSYRIENVKPGIVEIEIYRNSENCQDKIKSYNLKLPKYNKYYGNELCKGNEEFYLCQETLDEDIDYDTFVSRINSYKKNKASKEETNKEEIPEENEIIAYIKNNLTTIIIISIFVILLIVTLILTVKNYKKSRRLE